MPKRKKPTMMEVKTVLTNVIVEMNNIDSHLRKLDNAFESYLDFKGDKDTWFKWLENAAKEKENESKSNGTSPKNDKGSKGEKRGTTKIKSKAE